MNGWKGGVYLAHARTRVFSLMDNPSTAVKAHTTYVYKRIVITTSPKLSTKDKLGLTPAILHMDKAGDNYGGVYDSKGYPSLTRTLIKT